MDGPSTMSPMLLQRPSLHVAASSTRHWFSSKTGARIRIHSLGAMPLQGQMGEADLHMSQCGYWDAQCNLDDPPWDALGGPLATRPASRCESRIGQLDWLQPNSGLQPITANTLSRAISVVNNSRRSPVGTVCELEPNLLILAGFRFFSPFFGCNLLFLSLSLPLLGRGTRAGGSRNVMAAIG